MKKQILIMIFVLGAMDCFAQFNFSVSGGYALGVNKTIDNTLSGSGTTGSKMYYEKIGFGQGISPNFRLGYQLANKIDFGCSFSYLLSGKQVFTNTGEAEKPYYFYKEAKSKAYFITPDIRYHFNTWLYGGFGLVYCPYQITFIQDDYNIMPGNNIWKVLTEYQEISQNSLGSRFFIGFNYTISDKINIFSELGFNAMQLTPKKGKYSSYTIDGKDYLNSMTYYDLNWEYVNELEVTSPTTPTDKTIAEKRLLTNDNILPFSSLGIQIGIAYKL